MDPVDWQQRYLEHDTPWDKGRSHPMTEAALPFFIPGDILILGCGRGWDARALRDASSNHRIIGLDLSPLAIEDAQRLHGEEGFAWLQDDLFRADDDTRFSGVRNVWEHTCLCALPPTLRPAYVERLAALLPPLGIVCGVFFTQMNDGGTGPPWNTPEAELLDLFAPRFEMIHRQPVEHSFPGREKEETFLVLRRKKSNSLAATSAS